MPRGGTRFILEAFIRHVLLHPVLQQLGRMSYCIYLAHWAIIVSLLWLFLRGFPQLSSLEAAAGLLILGLPLVFGVAALLHVWGGSPDDEPRESPRLSPSGGQDGLMGPELESRRFFPRGSFYLQAPLQAGGFKVSCQG